MKIDGARILVTGGCGLIGSATVNNLLWSRNPSRIILLDNLSRGSLRNVDAALQDPRVKLVHGDIRDPGLMRKLCHGMDAVIHLAALRITACAAEPRGAFSAMCEGSFNIVEACQATGVKKVVAASSASVYGAAEAFPTDETHHPYGNRTLYGAAKLMLEGLLRSYNDMYGLPYVALRYFNVYGPRMDTHGKYTEVLIRWMDRIEAGQPPLILGDGRASMDFVYIDDVARANLLALESDAQDEVFNVASGVETSLFELAEKLLQVMGSDLKPEFRPERKVNAVPRRLADTKKAETVLRFRALTNLDDGLASLVDWWRATRSAEAA
jgi:UDP-glucose 4-epimerase